MAFNVGEEARFANNTVRSAEFREKIDKDVGDGNASTDRQNPAVEKGVDMAKARRPQMDAGKDQDR